MMPHSTEFLCHATSGHLWRGHHGAFTGVSIDTRSLTQGNIFFCIRGPRFDGHQFAAQAAERGASALVIDEDAQRVALEALGHLDIPVVVVNDTIAALGALAAAVRRQVDVQLVGLTGSSGKTTTKAFVAAVLESVGPTLATEGNLNNHLGVPLTLMKLNPSHRYAVIEMGMNAPGEIEYLARLAQPTLGVVTTIGAAHLEGVGDLAGVARAKGELLRSLDGHGWAIYPSNIVEKDILTDGLSAPSVTVGYDSSDDLRIVALEPNQDGTTARVDVQGQIYEVHVRLPGVYNLHNALLALAVAHILALDLEVAIEAIGEVRPLPLRSEWRVSPRGVSALLDCYNANPQSMAVALAHFTSEFPTGVVVLGDMLELGAMAEDAHRSVGQWLATHARDIHLVAIGSLGRLIADAALSAGLPSAQVVACSRVEDAHGTLENHHHLGRTLMFKGSRGAGLERCWHRLISSEEA
ncbi:MAG: UDP-N-acetylmuramoyl-tripeptide--D-alanyl-D-alanine ligase [Myxococcota bacterium]|nr:UDP-N-acetylmuramoyl-tripeptide--D-alanyl-D-alanine ligase [Myxococcota bacterium]